MAEVNGPQPLVLKRYSIFWALAVLMVLLGVVPLFFYSQKAVKTSKDYIEDSLRERQLLTANPASKQVQTMILGYGRHMEDLRSVFEVSSTDRDVQAAHENLLTGGILDRFVNEDCLFLLYSDAQGNALSASLPKLTGEESEQLRAFATRQAGKMPPGSDKFQGSEIFYLRLTSLGGMPTPAIALGLPLRKGDRATASLTGIFFLDKIQASLADYSKEFSLFVTDASGTLIFHSDPAIAGRPSDFANDPVVNRVISTGVFPNSPTNTNVSALEDGQHKTYLVTYTPLLILDYKWILFSQADRDKYLATVWALEKQSTYWIAGLILLSVVACFFTARLITKPILDMTEVARKFADQDFSTRANEGIHNEVGDLARAFNKMAKDIQDYIRTVEAQAEENKRLFMNSIRAIANAIDAKDPYTRGHSERVSAYSMIISREFGLNETRLRIMEIASLLHDVGKIGIEDKILRKPGALTNEEFEIMKTHPPKGADILASIPEMSEMIPGIKYHHERWGGGGYPDSLKGEQVPLLARIVGVADAFDAMTTNRPYQRAMTFPVAAARVNELMNTVYDPRVVEAFNRAYQKGAFQRFQQQIQGQQQAG